MGEEMDGALVGFLAGMAVAMGGAIKDAPYEGFKAKTFWRSPLIGAFWGSWLSKKYSLEPIPLFLATIGLERATVEAYKLYRATVKKNYVPGKFIYGEWGVPVK
ncbi:MAG: hypothetical protein J7K48_04615 [Thermococcus sp.]|nr:hypothetical protein [Thermococcus sp.]